MEQHRILFRAQWIALLFLQISRHTRLVDHVLDQRHLALAHRGSAIKSHRRKWTRLWTRLVPLREWTRTQEPAALTHHTGRGIPLRRYDLAHAPYQGRCQLGRTFGRRDIGFYPRILLPKQWTKKPGLQI